jgi:hypothetical protein
MRAVLFLCCLTVATACSKKPDKCQQFVDKSMKVLTDLALMRGARLGDVEKEQLVEGCRKSSKAGKSDPQIDCVLAAKDDVGVSACYTKGYEDYLKRSKEIEAKIQLGKLGKMAKVEHATTSEFPKGKVGPTPATPCCAEPAKECSSTDTTWADPVWQALDFTIEGAFRYQYSYESDGKTFTATATGDVGCTGKPTTTTITGKIGPDGAAEVTKL